MDELLDKIKCKYLVFSTSACGPIEHLMVSLKEVCPPRVSVHGYHTFAPWTGAYRWRLGLPYDAHNLLEHLYLGDAMVEEFGEIEG